LRTIAHGERREADCFIALVDRQPAVCTVINYIDRQTLSLLAPYLKIEYQWSNSDSANIAIAFRVTYSIGQTVFGRLMDRIGTRRGLTPNGNLVFAGLDVDVAGEWLLQLCHVSVPAGCGGIRQLAGRNE
jgi:MFS family permease